jgi:glutamate-1-semialdehyde 2,1-aminomutase
METSKKLFTRAEKVIPGGVNSPVRACRAVGCDPLFIAEANGSSLRTADGDTLMDYVMSWGPLLLGHGYPDVARAAKEAVDRGASFGAPCEAEVLLAEAVVDALPCVDMVRMVNSGTEAAMSALRLARGVTDRSRVIKFEGCYHGHVDAFLASAGSGVATLSIPGTPGVPPEIVRDTLLAPYNDLKAVSALFSEHRDEIAAVFVEPVAGNMGLVRPGEGFLEGLRELCDEYGALLVFDEVITGFRVGYGGAQKRFGVLPDITVLGKIIGGGFPVGAYGGTREIMQNVAPVGDVYQAGTLSGNPVAMAAGVATLKALAKADYVGLERKTGDLAEGLADILRHKGLPVCVNRIASMFTLFFSEGPVTNFASAKRADPKLYAAFYREMRAAGVNFAPSGFECAFTSFAHTDEDIRSTLAAAEKIKM